MKKMRKIWVAALVGTMSFGLFGCGDTDGAQASNKEQFYGVGGVTAVKLLSEEFSAGALSGLSAVQTLRASASEDVSDVKAQAENFQQYLSMLDGFIDEGAVSTQISANTDEGYGEYASKLVITGRDVLGNATTHVMYYSETLLPSKPDDDDDLFENEVENEYKLTGVLVMDGVDYPMEGERSEEWEKGESEAEIRIRAYLSEEDRTTYVEVKQESEKEEGEAEEEYVYSIYKNGALIEQTSVEFEVENERGERVAEYEVEFLSGEGKGRYAVKRITENGAAKLRVNYFLNGKSGYFTVVESLNGQGEKVYEYTFADGSKVVFGNQNGGGENPVNPTPTAA